MENQENKPLKTVWFKGICEPEDQQLIGFSDTPSLKRELFKLKELLEKQGVANELFAIEYPTLFQLLGLANRIAHNFTTPIERDYEKIWREKSK